MLEQLQSLFAAPLVPYIIQSLPINRITAHIAIPSSLSLSPEREHLRLKSRPTDSSTPLLTHEGVPSPPPHGWKNTHTYMLLSSLQTAVTLLLLLWIPEWRMFCMPDDGERVIF